MKYLFINISKFCRYKDKFSKFANDVLYRARHPIKIPLGASVFDYVLDESSGTFIRWSDKSQERMKILAGGFTITPEVRDMIPIVLRDTVKMTFLLKNYF